jgi:hypothetical protein
MQPTRRQEWIANNKPLQVLLLITTGGSMAAGAVYYLREVGLPLRLEGWGSFLVCLVLIAAIGYLVGGLLSLFVLGPVYYSQGLENGAPYSPGDRVYLLTGRHRGRIVPVYEVWDERSAVRVELSDAEREAVTDVFGYIEVCRVSPRTDARDVPAEPTEPDLGAHSVA